MAPGPQQQTATTRTVAQVNRTIVINALRTRGPMSRVKIGAVTGLSSATVSRLVEALKDESLVVAGEREPSTGGRPSRQLRFNAEAQGVLAIALGPEKVVGTVADLAGTVRRRVTRPLARTAPQAAASIVDSVVDFVAEMAKTARAIGIPARAITVGVPGLTTGSDGLVEFAPAVGWSDMPLGLRIGEKLDIPVIVENDVNLVALAAHRRSVAQGVQHLVAIVADVGVGAGLIVNGRLHRGRLAAAGEIGYLLMERKSLDRTWPGLGDFESRVGLSGLETRMAAAGMTILPPGTPALTALFEASRNGDRHAIRLVRELADDFAVLIAAVAVIISPEMVALGGRTFALGGDLLIPIIEARLQGRIPVVPRLVAIDADELQMMGAAEIAIEATIGSASIVR